MPKSIEQEVEQLFKEFSQKANRISQDTNNHTEAIEKICNMVSSELAAVTGGYIVDIYTNLANDIKKLDYFQTPEHLNAFYSLNLRSKLNDKFRFDVKSVEDYKKGICFQEVNELYATACAVAGTLAVGGILKYALAGIINIPFVIVIAGAVLAGFGTKTLVHDRNEMSYICNIDEFLRTLKKEILDWLCEIERYFASEVRKIYISAVTEGEA